MRRLISCLSCVAVVSAAACAATGAGGASDGGLAGSIAGSGGDAGGGGQGSDNTFGSGGRADNPTDAVLYVHSNEGLFVGDPAIEPLQLNQVGTFDCVGGGGDADGAMTDIAVNAEGHLWGVSARRVYRIELEGTTARCTRTIELNNPEEIRFYGLTFAPTGILHPDKEILIGANSAGELWTIDIETGAISQHGTFGIVPSSDNNGNYYDNAGKNWALSGDMAFFAGEGSPVGFATVRDCPNPLSAKNCNPIDTLLELNVARVAQAGKQTVTKSVRGQLVRAAGCNDSAAGYGSVYGLAAYEGKVLGFARSEGNGLAIDIDNSTGAACLFKEFPGEAWAGAGITTLAPVDAPPPK